MTTSGHMTVSTSESFLSVAPSLKQNNINFVLEHSMQQTVPAGKHAHHVTISVQILYVKHNLLYLSKEVIAARERRYKVNNFKKSGNMEKSHVDNKKAVTSTKQEKELLVLKRRP